MNATDTLTAELNRGLEDERLKTLAREVCALMYVVPPPAEKEAIRRLCRIHDISVEARTLYKFGATILISLAMAHASREGLNRDSTYWFRDVVEREGREALGAHKDGSLKLHPDDPAPHAISPMNAYIEQVLKPRLAAMEEE